MSTHSKILSTFERLEIISALQRLREDYSSYRNSISILANTPINQGISPVLDKIREFFSSHILSSVPDSEIVDENLSDFIKVDDYLIFKLHGFDEKYLEFKEILSSRNREDVRMINTLQDSRGSFYSFNRNYNQIENSSLELSRIRGELDNQATIIKDEDDMYFIISIKNLITVEDSLRHYIDVSLRNKYERMTSGIERIVSSVTHFFSDYDNAMTEVNEYRERIKAQIEERLREKKLEYSSNVVESIYVKNDLNNIYVPKELTAKNISYVGMDVLVYSKDGSEHEGWKVLPGFEEHKEIEGFTFEGWGKITGYDEEKVIVQDYIYTVVDIEDWIPHIPDSPDSKTYKESLEISSELGVNQEQMSISSFISSVEEEEVVEEESSTHYEDGIYFHAKAGIGEQYISIESGNKTLHKTFEDLVENKRELLDSTIEKIHEDNQSSQSYEHYVYVGKNKMKYPVLTKVMMFDYKNVNDVVNFPLVSL